MSTTKNAETKTVRLSVDTIDARSASKKTLIALLMHKGPEKAEGHIDIESTTRLIQNLRAAKICFPELNGISISTHGGAIESGRAVELAEATKKARIEISAEDKDGEWLTVLLDGKPALTKEIAEEVATTLMSSVESAKLVELGKSFVYAVVARCGFDTDGEEIVRYGARGSVEYLSKETVNVFD